MWFYLINMKYGFIVAAVVTANNGSNDTDFIFETH